MPVGFFMRGSSTPSLDTDFSPENAASATTAYGRPAQGWTTPYHCSTWLDWVFFDWDCKGLEKSCSQYMQKLHCCGDVMQAPGFTHQGCLSHMSGLVV